MTTLLDYRLAEAKRLNLRVLKLKVTRGELRETRWADGWWFGQAGRWYRGIPVEIVT